MTTTTPSPAVNSPGNSIAAPISPTPFRALCFKELRETLPWVLLALLTNAIAVAYAFYSESERLISSSNQGWNPSEHIWPTLTATTLFTSAITLALLGFLQFIREARRSRREFLLHRPASPDLIFLAKTAVVLPLGLLAILIPWFLGLLWAANPNHLPAPFTWYLALPSLAAILTAITYYFTSALIALRPARWYGSRLLPLGLPLLASICAVALPEFWQTLLATAILSLLAFLAARTTFHINDSGQPLSTWSRFNLFLHLATGLFFIAIAAISFLSSFTSTLYYGPNTYYDITRQGIVVKRINDDYRRTETIADLSDKVLQTKPFNEIYNNNEYKNMFLSLTGILLKPRPYDFTLTYQQVGKYNTNLPHYQDQSSWTFDHLRHCFVIYDRRPQFLNPSPNRLLGALGPKGFLPGRDSLDPTDSGFLGTFLTTDIQLNQLCATSQAVYHINTQTFAVQLLFTPAPDETITGVTSTNINPLTNPRQIHTYIFTTRRVLSCQSFSAPITPLFTAPAGQTISAASVFDMNLPDEAVLIHTPNLLTALDPTGRTLLKTPPQPSQAYYLSFGRLANPDRSVLWYHNYNYFNRRDTTPDLVLFVAPDGAPLAREELPPIHYNYNTRPCSPGFGFFVPPCFDAFIALVESLSDGPRHQYEEDFLRPYFTFTLAGALLASLATFVVTRRYRLPLRRQLLWSILNFFFGYIGLLTLFSLGILPQLVPCPACQRRRPVTSPLCPHCHAPFPQPAPNGTEIFA